MSILFTTYVITLAQHHGRTDRRTDDLP